MRILILLCLTACSGLPKTQKLVVSPTSQQVVDQAHARAQLLKTRTSNLYVVNLPAGDTGSINIGWFNNGATKLDPNTWLSQGYEGIVFRGQGVDVTHLRQTSWDGITLAVGRHNGIVRLENLTLHAGSDKGTAIGQQNLAKELKPNFQFEMVNVKAVVDHPFEYFKRNGSFRIVSGGTGHAVNDVLTLVGNSTSPAKFRVTTVGARGVVTGVSVASRGTYTTNLPFVAQATTSSGSGTGFTVVLGARPKWLLFGYNSDLFLHNVWLNAKQAVEHASYWHGFAQHGMYVSNTYITASGAEGFKVRSDATETAYAGPNTIVHITDTTIRDWYQCWSWRGGAGVVLQGSASHVVLERVKFFGGGALNCQGLYPNVPSQARSFAIALSSEGESYDQETGAINTGFGNGHVVLDRILAYGSSEYLWRNNQIRCGRNGGSQKCAKSFKITNSALYGYQMFLSIGDIPPGSGLLTGSNTPDLKSYAESQGVNTSVETVIPRYPLVPVSQGATW